MFVLAGAFGITAAILLFKPAPPAPQVVVTMPSAVAALPPTTAPAATTPGGAATDTVAVGAGSDAGQPRPGAVASRGSSGGGSHPNGTGAATDPDLQNLIRGQTGGPSAGPGGGGAGGGGGTALTENQVRNVVSAHAPGIKRTCWERTTSAVNNANIDVKIVVSATGSVQSADATGNDPVIAKCIENSVRAWIFPPSDGPSTITVPFRFLRQ